MNESLIMNAQSYAARRQLEIAGRLGSGKDGTVFVAKRKVASAKVAIKVHRFEDTYLREKPAYERLRKREVNSIRGFNVPEMADFDDEFRILEMTIVKRPFVLDFAAAYLDRRSLRINGTIEFVLIHKQHQILVQLVDAFGVYRVDLAPIATIWHKPKE